MSMNGARKNLLIQFDSESETPGELEQRLRIMDNVLRYLCVKQEA